MDQPLNHGAPLPPRGQVRWHRITGPAKGQPLRAVILGETFTAQWTHFDGTTLPCTNTPECARCRAGLSPRYNGYIPALVGSPGQLRVLALTYHGCCQFIDLLKRRGTLRGLDVTMFRRFPSPRAPIVIRVEREIKPDLLPESFDVVDSLARMWGVNAAFLARGCRRIGADETAETYVKARIAQERNAGYNMIPTGEEAA